ARNLVADKRKKHVQNSNFHCRFLANADFKPLFMRLAWRLGVANRVVIDVPRHCGLDPQSPSFNEIPALRRNDGA
ncbi:MAG: hypothetical protein FWF44_07375, partial [Defluviitaleaceae bacterium]|nr:hypothetical protein [Defluviitaleaceae bacterium]